MGRALAPRGGGGGRRYNGYKGRVGKHEGKNLPGKPWWGWEDITCILTK